MIGADFEQNSAFQYQYRCLKRQVEEFQSGEKYRKMEEEYKALVRRYNRETARLKKELSDAHRETVTVRRYWGEIVDEQGREHKREEKKLLTRIKQLEKWILELE